MLSGRFLNAVDRLSAQVLGVYLEALVRAV